MTAILIQFTRETADDRGRERKSVCVCVCVCVCVRACVYVQGVSSALTFLSLVLEPEPYIWSNTIFPLLLFLFISLSLSLSFAFTLFSEHHCQFQRAVWAPHCGQAEAVHPEPGHKAAEPWGHYGGYHGAERGLPVPGASGQPLRANAKATHCLRYGQ